MWLSLVLFFFLKYSGVELIPDHCKQPPYVQNRIIQVCGLPGRYILVPTPLAPKCPDTPISKFQFEYKEQN